MEVHTITVKRKAKRSKRPATQTLASIKKGRYAEGSTILTLKQREIFLRTLMEGWTASRAAIEAKAPRQTFYNLRENDENFATAWKAAEESGTDRLEDIVRQRAEGYEKPLVFKGRKTGQTITEHSDVLAMFMLNGRRPEKFRQNVKVDANFSVSKDYALAASVMSK